MRAVVPALALLFCLASVPTPVHGGGGGGDRPADPGSDEDREYRIKAAFLLHFVRYTTWPKECFEDAASPIVLTVVGADPFGPVLKETFRGETIQGRRVEIAHAQEVPRELGGHIVFCSELSRAAREDLLTKASRRPLLVIGESPGFAEDGGSINFFIQDQKTRFEINTEALAEARLEMSPAVLKLAKIVRTKRGGT